MEKQDARASKPRPWVRPAVKIMSAGSAEASRNTGAPDGGSAFGKTRS
jgi:hypothetical protein